MPIEFRCPNCDALFRVKDELAGRKAECARCGNVSVIPAPERPVAELVEDPAMTDPFATRTEPTRTGEEVTSSPTQPVTTKETIAEGIMLANGYSTGMGCFWVVVLAGILGVSLVLGMWTDSGWIAVGAFVGLLTMACFRPMRVPVALILGLSAGTFTYFFWTDGGTIMRGVGIVAGLVAFAFVSFVSFVAVSRPDIGETIRPICWRRKSK